MRKKNKLSWPGKILLFFNVLAIAGLLVVYAGTRISPHFFWPTALPGLFYPILLFINIGFVLLWIIRQRLYFLLSLIAILAGYNHIESFISFSDSTRQLPANGKNIHVLSYNVRVFDLYNYGPRWQLNFTNRNNIFNYLESNSFDIICLQEFVHDKSGAFKTLDTLPLLLKAQYAHTGFTRSSRNTILSGLATFSAFPVANKGMIKFPTRGGNLCIYTDIMIENDTVRVYNVHFESIGLSPEDYLFVENMTNAEQISDRDYFRDGSIRILDGLINAYRQRAIQVEMVAEHISQCPYPVILAGDFNDTPHSYAYRKINKLLNDSFKSGRGTGQTYVRNLPGFRIDYIMHSKQFKPYNLKTGSQKYSDHSPVSVWLNYKSENFVR
ncbi:MAG: endonuclease/exonuclease/phosphatase family protein [Bacteroidales bacterium]